MAIFASEAAYHAEALYNLTKLWKVAQQPDRSLEAQAKLEGTTSPLTPIESK